MCGGDLTILPDSSTAECQYCGSLQTIPVMDNEKKLNLFSRANRLRAAGEFDKASGVYESIVADFPEESEAYWGLVLCKYGIEYVDDPATGKKVPTCHRSSYDSVMKDSDFEMALENADVVARKVYREEAKYIEEIRKGILEVSSGEDPYDIFICYKETDFNGKRTLDSVLAQDIYDALTKNGYRVFFSRITLEGKLGQAYEPYIFAALSSAKIMLAIGTDYEYFNAVWVKNEWSRFLKMMVSDSEKFLIPCYKGIDAYDMPEEFARLQAQDLDKMGAIQDIVRGVEKLLPKKAAQPTVVQFSEPAVNTAPLIKRGNISLEDQDWEKAKECFDHVLNIDPECAEAYLGLAMCQEKICDPKFLIFRQKTEERYYKRAKQYAGSQLREQLEAWEAEAQAVRHAHAQRLEEERLTQIHRLEEECKAQYEARNALTLQGSLMIGAGEHHSIAIKNDGTVLTAGYNGFLQCNTPWHLVVSVCAGGHHTLALMPDGTVKATGYNGYGQCNVSKWQDIVQISAGGDYTIGLQQDGTVNIVGDCKNSLEQVGSWKNIVAVSAGFRHCVALTKTGSVVAAGHDLYQQCQVQSWDRIVALAAGRHHTVGLKLDGTVVAIGQNTYTQCDVSHWQDVMSITAGDTFTAALTMHNTVLIAGPDELRQEVADWKNIVQICAGNRHLLGVTKDGRVFAAGDRTNGKCDVTGWKLFDNFQTLAQERLEQVEAYQQENFTRMENAKKWRAQGLCEQCGGEFVGVFMKKCGRCGTPKI